MVLCVAEPVGENPKEILDPRGSFVGPVKDHWEYDPQVKKDRAQHVKRSPGTRNTGLPRLEWFLLPGQLPKGGFLRFF